MKQESPFRLFELTILVHIPKHWDELPHTAADWFERVVGCSQEHFTPAGGSLEGIRELRYPLAEDVIEARRNDDRRYW